MYISMFGCKRYPSGQYVVGDQDDLIAAGVPKEFRCTDPQPAPAITGAFWVLFIMVCSFVMLSLFIGVITMAMNVSSFNVLTWLAACLLL